MEEIYWDEKIKTKQTADKIGNTTLRDICQDNAKRMETQKISGNDQAF